MVDFVHRILQRQNIFILSTIGLLRICLFLRLLSDNRQDIFNLKLETNIALLTVFCIVLFLALLLSLHVAKKFHFELKWINSVIESGEKNNDYKPISYYSHRYSSESKQIIDSYNEMITTFQKREEKLRKLSYTDTLTGIANRRAFEEYFNKTYNDTVLKQKPVSLAIIDIDHFKEFNDTFGHLKGDKCLKDVALTLENVIKHSNHFVARIGGEEFIMILSGMDMDEASNFAEKVRKKVENLRISRFNHHNYESSYITISIGVASSCPTQKHNKESLIRLADRALYKAKHHGRNKVVGKRRSPI